MVYVPRTQSSTAVSPSRKKTTDEKYSRDQMQFGQDEMRLALDQAKSAPPTAASNSTYSTKTTRPVTAGTRQTMASPMTGSATYATGTKTAMSGGAGGFDTSRMPAPTSPLDGPISENRTVDNSRLLDQAVSGFDRGMLPGKVISPEGVEIATGISNPDLSKTANPAEFDAEQAMQDYLENMLTGTVPTDEAEALIREMIQDKTELGLRQARAGMGRAGLASSGAMQAGEADVRRAAGQQAQQAILGMEERARAEERAMREAGVDMFMRGEDLERGRIADAIQISIIAEQLGVSPEEVLAAMQGQSGGGGITTPEDRVLDAKQQNLEDFGSKSVVESMGGDMAGTWGSRGEGQYEFLDSVPEDGTLVDSITNPNAEQTGRRVVGPDGETYIEYSSPQMFGMPPRLLWVRQ